MPPLLGSDAYQRPPPTVVEIAHDTVLSLRREARLRATTVERLARDLLDVIASDGLVGAVLDVDEAPADPTSPRT
jgi:hypothetical protein